MLILEKSKLYYLLFVTVLLYKVYKQISYVIFSMEWQSIGYFFKTILEILKAFHCCPKKKKCGIEFAIRSIDNYLARENSCIQKSLKHNFSSINFISSIFYHFVGLSVHDCILCAGNIIGATIRSTWVIILRLCSLNLTVVSNRRSFLWKSYWYNIYKYNVLFALNPNF